MFFHNKKLQYQVRVDKPSPQFAKLLQQAIGGNEGEIPQAQENQEVNYTFFVTNINESSSKAEGRWTQGTSVDGKGQFRGQPAKAYGPEPKLGPPEPLTHAQVEEMQNPGNASPDSLIDKVKGALS